ncbi:MAG TPA: polyketide cyclase [Propionibacteriaceae bacterium]|nr:polyketide cyclase [Propionibacteriaceae bacterium]
MTSDDQAALATPTSDRSSEATRGVIEPFVELFYGQRAIRAAMEAYVTNDYVQHNPGVADGREAAIVALEASIAGSDLHLDIQRVLVDGSFAVIHLHAWRDGQRGGSVVDMYRIEDGLIVEHWDVIQQVPESAANPHPMF